MLPQQLLARSSYWESKLVDFVEQTSVQELQRLVDEARLTHEELKRVKDALPEGINISLKGELRSGCPSVSVAVNRGAVEQTPEGWRYLGSGKPVVVCSAAWRIGATVLDPAVDGGKSESKSILEFYEADRWQGCEVSSDRLRKNTAEVLHEARSQLGLPPICIARKYEKDLYYISILLNPPAPPSRAERLGIDLADGLLRTSRCELSLQNGNLSSHEHLTDGKSLLPRADGAPPRRETVINLLNCPPARLTVGRPSRY